MDTATLLRLQRHGLLKGLPGAKRRRHVTPAPAPAPTPAPAAAAPVKDKFPPIASLYRSVWPVMWPTLTNATVYVVPSTVSSTPFTTTIRVLKFR